MKKLLLASLATLSVLTALPAAAQFSRPESAVKYRNSAMSLMGNHMGRLGAMVNGRVPFDAKVAAENAEIATMLSRLPFTAFGEGTNVGNNKAKPEVWSKPEEFRAAAAKSQEEMAKLNAAAKTGNLDAIKVAFGAAAKSCDSCHDVFQKK